jgi:hypothetical protein
MEEDISDCVFAVYNGVLNAHAQSYIHPANYSLERPLILFPHFFLLLWREVVLQVTPLR